VSRIENPLGCAACIALWRLFSDLDLSEAKQQRFKSLHECFTRELEGRARAASMPIRTCWRARATRSSARVRPSRGRTVLQAKGFPYP
jgi:phosphatidylserine decarboxylase